jgi:hypothetical protein
MKYTNIARPAAEKQSSLQYGSPSPPVRDVVVTIGPSHHAQVAEFTRAVTKDSLQRGEQKAFTRTWLRPAWLMMLGPALGFAIGA